ncbi:MAG: methyltransferase domain-containing protein [Candidatus Electronema sp. V4]|uniref:methyltransferase domain-containing protein n=1 Tax=Candidatus Electronema sp. V4 TaxID=3454756 RepID=UPI0040559B88
MSKFRKKLLQKFNLITLSRPKRVQCNLCGWEGRHFVSDAWHKHIKCPACGSNTRHRLFFCILQHSKEFSLDRLIKDKKLLHFAPEWIVSSKVKKAALRCTTADFNRTDCDLQIDMSNMPKVAADSVDAVIAFDVLEHIFDYKQALAEIWRILSPGGFAIFTVPQKDHLPETYEDPVIISPEERTKHFGQWDHVRMFGDDFPQLVASKGFLVTTVDEKIFPEELRKKHVLFPPELSSHPLATNFRKVFFCQKQADML